VTGVGVPADQRFLSGKAAIAGIGATEFSKSSGRSELRLACEAVLAALADAGLRPGDVDGMTTFAMDNNPENVVARSLGIPELTFFTRVTYGGGAACAPFEQAAMAVVTGVADVVVVYRAFNERSGQRFGAGTAGRPTTPTTENERMAWLNPYGLLTPAQSIAMFARRYMHEYGATSEDFGRVAVVQRKYASVNPRAYFYNRPITLEDHQQSRWIVEPLHLLDCCQESDGGQALVIVSAERAKDLPQPPAIIIAAAQGMAGDMHSMNSFYRRTITDVPDLAVVARQLWAMSGLGVDDIDAAILYDHFSPAVPLQLEELGFCGRGEARHFIADGNLELDGRLPTNTNGGQLGEAYIHGINGVAEAVRLVRGTSTSQPAKVDHVIVTAGPGVPTSGLILGRAA
jgi:acetyl-CoA acetyltransferase